MKVSLLSQYLHEMVTMSTLQGSVFEVVPTSDEVARHGLDPRWRVRSWFGIAAVVRG